MWRFVRLALRADIGLAREIVNADNDQNHWLKHGGMWSGMLYRMLVTNWKGSETESRATHVTMTYMAPVIVALYAVTFTVLATEMIGGAEGIWY